MANKSLLGITLAAAIGIVCATNTEAKTYNFAAPVHYGSAFLGVHNVSTGSFTDIINFTLSKSGTLSASVTSKNLTSGGHTLFSISGLNASIYTSGGTLLGSGTNFTLSGSQSAGSYYIQITGTGTGSLGGQYNTALNFAATSVSSAPEPTTWMLMIGGLGLVAAYNHRRKSSAASFSPALV